MKCIVKAVFVLLMVLLHTCYCVLGDAPGTWRIDDFEDGDLKAPSGLYWIVIADDLAGGSTEAKIGIRPGGAAGSRHALGLTGRLSGRKNSFAGAWVSLDQSGRPVNLGAYEGVRLRVKGSGRLQVGFRGPAFNFMADVDAGAEWRIVDVPFSSLAPLGKVPEGTRWSPGAINYFGVTTPQLPRGEDGEPGEVAFEVDDVVLYGRGAGNEAPAASGTTGGIAVVPFTPSASIPSTGWVRLADDPARDGNVPSLPDATLLEAIPSSADGTLWVRVTLREPPHDRWIGMNVVLDVDGDPANGGTWWGANSAFKFDRLVTVWCTRVAEGCQGYIGVADPEQAASFTLAPGSERRVKFAIDRERGAFVLGVPREALGLGNAGIRLVAAVGSALLYADDVPGQGAATLR